MKLNFILLFFASLSLSFPSCIIMNDLRKQAGIEYAKENQNKIFPDGTYTGLTSIVDSHDTTSIIMVHGIKTKSENHFAFLRKTIASELGFDPKYVIPDTAFNNESTAPPFDSSKIKSLPGKAMKYIFKKGQDNKTLIVYDINWSPVTSPVKDYIKDRFDQPKQQTRLAQYLKDEYLIDAIGDMALYLNDGYRFKIHLLFKTVLNDLKGDNNVVIAGGFGSQILFDVLTPSPSAILMIDKLNHLDSLLRITGPIDKKILENDVNEKHPALNNKEAQYQNKMIGDAIDIAQQQGTEASLKKLKTDIENLRDSIPPFALKKIQHIFLLSNQLPFTSLMTLPSGTPNKHENYVAHLYNDITDYANYAKVEKLNIVSFYESNDAFGYKLPKPFLPSQKRINVVNVRVENAYSLSFNPDKLTRDYLSPRISDAKLKNVLYQFIDQEHTKQKLMFNVEGPGDFARYSPRVVNGIVDKERKMSQEIKTDPVDEDMDRALPNPPKPNKGWVRRLGENLATHQLEHALKEIDRTSATLPFRLPSRHISGNFEGIRKSVQSNEVTQVLAIHGMRYPKPNHYDEMFALMARQLDFYTTPTCDVDYYFDETGRTFPKSDSVAGNGSVRVIKFENANGKSLVFYTVYWAPITLAPKQWLDNICKDPSASVTSQAVKEEIVNDGLGDVILAFKEFGENIFNLMDLAMNLMEKDTNLCNTGSISKTDLAQDNVYMISSSLGSYILYKYLVSRTENNTGHPVNGILKRTDKIFMLTNQIALIDFLKIPTVIDTNHFDQKMFETFQSRLSNISANTEIIAFNDPNDILSFRVQKLDTAPLKVKHIYINLAQGYQVNMNGLIKWIYKFDKRISGKTLFKILTFKDRKRRVFTRNYYRKLRLQYKYSDLLPNRVNRFFLFKNKEYNEFKVQLKKDFEDEKDRLNKALISDNEKKTAMRDLKKSRLKNRNLRKLKKKTILMPLLRTVVNGKAYQDFVVDLNTAHTGPKKNRIVIQMMCDGSKDVKRTNTPNE